MLAYSENKEKDLLLLVASGNQEAFQVLFNKYRDKIYSLGIYLTRSEFLAEEIVQDVFLKVWEKREQLQTLDYFNAWLRTVAKNTCSNYLRSLAIEKLALSTYETRSYDDINSPENVFIAKEYKAILDMAIQQLPPQQKKVYQLSRVAGKKQGEIALEMNISVYTVKEYIKLANSAIRRHIENKIDKAILLAVALYL